MCSFSAGCVVVFMPKPDETESSLAITLTTTLKKSLGNSVLLVNRNLEEAETKGHATLSKNLERQYQREYDRSVSGTDIIEDKLGEKAMAFHALAQSVMKIKNEVGRKRVDAKADKKIQNRDTVPHMAHTQAAPQSGVTNTASRMRSIVSLSKQEGKSPKLRKAGPQGEEDTSPKQLKSVRKQHAAIKERKAKGLVRRPNPLLAIARRQVRVCLLYMQPYIQMYIHMYVRLHVERGGWRERERERCTDT